MEVTDGTMLFQHDGNDLYDDFKRVLLSRGT